MTTPWLFHKILAIRCSPWHLGFLLSSLFRNFVNSWLFSFAHLGIYENEQWSHWSQPLGLRVSWVKTKMQAFNDVLDAAILSVPACGENVEVTERFSYFGSEIHVSACCEPEVNRRLGRAWRVMDSLDHGVWRCQYLCGRTKARIFRSLVPPVLFYGCETWTLTRDLRWRLNSFGIRSLRRIHGYHWTDFVSNERLLRETQMRFVTCLVRERQL